MAQHADDSGAAAPGLFLRHLAGLVVINGAMVAEWWMEGKRKTKATEQNESILAHISMTCLTGYQTVEQVALEILEKQEPSPKAKQLQTDIAEMGHCAS